MILIEEMRIYILNTTRFYHEDFEEYPGAWFSCPVDFEEIKERLGVQSEEEIEIEDYELPFPLDGLCLTDVYLQSMILWTSLASIEAHSAIV